MISSKKKVVFLHVPKTGGNSIQNILVPYADENLVIRGEHQDGIERFELSNPNSGNLTKHASFSDYKAVYGGELSDFYVFCCIRNPFDRLVSYFFSPHRGKVKWSPSAFRKFVRSGEVKPLEHFLKDPDTGQYIKPHSIIRFETLQGDFERVCDEIGIPRCTLPVRNKSSKPDYRECYDRALMRYVESTYSTEIELGDYRFADDL